MYHHVTFYRSGAHANCWYNFWRIVHQTLLKLYGFEAAMLHDVLEFI